MQPQGARARGGGRPAAGSASKGAKLQLVVGQSRGSTDLPPHVVHQQGRQHDAVLCACLLRPTTQDTAPLLQDTCKLEFDLSPSQRQIGTKTCTSRTHEKTAEQAPSQSIPKSGPGFPDARFQCTANRHFSFWIRYQAYQHATNGNDPCFRPEYRTAQKHQLLRLQNRAARIPKSLYVYMSRA